jgi:hypothetical protein
VTDGYQHCSPSPEDCDGVRLEDGEAITLASGVTGKIYRLKVLDVRLVRSTKPPKR